MTHHPEHTLYFTLRRAYTHKYIYLICKVYNCFVLIDFISFRLSVPPSRAEDLKRAKCIYLSIHPSSVCDTTTIRRQCVPPIANRIRFENRLGRCWETELNVKERMGETATDSISSCRLTNRSHFARMSMHENIAFIWFDDDDSFPLEISFEVFQKHRKRQKQQHIFDSTQNTRPDRQTDTSSTSCIWIHRILYVIYHIFHQLQQHRFTFTFH